MSPFEIPLPLGRVAERVLGLRQLDRLYRKRQAGNFVDEALRLLQIAIAPAGTVDQIPASGAVIIVANHPCGALDGLALAHLAQRRRADVKLLANHLLLRIPELTAHVIAVNPFQPNDPANARGLREARRWLAAGGVLVVFPAGEVSSIGHSDRAMTDGEWKSGVLKLVDWTAATVVPAFIHAENGWLFRTLGRVHPLLRTMLLVRELLARRGTSVRVSIGAAIAAERLQALAGAEARLAYLRARTYALGEHGLSAHRSAVEDVFPVAPAEAPEMLAAEIQALPGRALLLTSGPYEVYCATSAAVPTVVREIGRLREDTFRRVDEGTGQARDLDEFDATYTHLFVWHTGRRCIVGAYRLGLTDRLGAISVPRALYTRTLFRFGPTLLRQLGPAIELGRSFVRAEFQRESNALLLLWRGIGAFVAREPRYRMLFGAVSISANYQSLTRQLLARYLSTSAFLSTLAAHVRPTRPLAVGPDATQLVHSQVVASLDDVEQLVAELEGGRGLPVLLRQYLKLNARLLGFSLDPSFGNVLDGLVLVDLLDVKPALLQRYLGRESAAAFLRHHRSPGHDPVGATLPAASRPTCEPMSIH